jgi:peptide/nickel transport system substrate-binding protein
VANPDYWGDPALLETVTFRYINDPNALNNAMLAGDIDVLNGVSAPELLEAFGDESQFTVYTGLTNGEVTLALNGGNAPLDQLEVRQAISYGIDRQAVVDGAYFGYGELIGSHTTPLDPYYEDLNDIYPYDPEQAAALLAEAGVDEGTTLRMILPPVSYAERGGQIIASQLTELGFNVEIQNVEWGVWLEDVFANKDYDLSIVAHVEPRDISQYGNPDYYWAYDNPDVAALVVAADAEPDDAARNEIYKQIQEQITADAANVWPFLLPALSVTKPGVTGFIANAPGLSLDITKLAFNP